MKRFIDRSVGAYFFGPPCTLRLLGSQVLASGVFSCTAFAIASYPVHKPYHVRERWKPLTGSGSTFCYYYSNQSIKTL